MLPPPPKRAPGGRRLNGVPKLLILGAGLLVLGGLAYSYRARMMQTTTAAQNAGERKPEAASGSAITANKPQPGPRPPVTTVSNPIGPPAETTGNGAEKVVPTDQAKPSDAPPPSGGQPAGEDMATQARRAAWTTYYAQMAQVQQAKLAAVQDALKADSALSSAATQPGGAQPGGPQQQQLATAQPGLGFPGASPGASPSYGYGGFLPPPALPDATGAREKQAFMGQAGNLGRDDVLVTTLRPPLSPYVLSAGWDIPAVAERGANSDVPGQFTARVRATVYDSATGMIPLIPVNAKLIGTYDTVVSAGQTRIPTVITSIEFPDGSSLPLGAMPAADQSGFAGLHDQVHTHLGEKFVNALLYSLPGAAIQLGVGGNNGGYGGYNAQQVAAGSVAQQLGQVAQESARAGLAIPNTAIVRPGYAFTVQLTKAVPFPGPYVDRRAAPAAGINVAAPIMR